MSHTPRCNRIRRFECAKFDTHHKGAAVKRIGNTSQLKSSSNRPHASSRMILSQDLFLPFEIPAPVCFNVSNSYSSFKLESDLPLPFEELNKTKRKPFFGISKYRRQRKPATHVQTRRPRVALQFPQAPPNNRNSRRKANVLVQVDCSQTSALQCVRYIENKRIVFAMWIGSNQWSS